MGECESVVRVVHREEGGRGERKGGWGIEEKGGTLTKLNMDIYITLQQSNRATKKKGEPNNSPRIPNPNLTFEMRREES